ncbi:MAG TPA: hypothetical protein VFE14_04145 [Micromonosporaceae bacterium]|jgi:hypothetical protein|nr:hypothetical protein [Micromonosporaceae bacterium]
MTAWDDYQAAARELDADRRAAAAVAAEQSGVLRAAREELAAVRKRLLLQQSRFTEATTRHRVRPPELAPTDTEVMNALAPGSSPAAILAALHHARGTLDAADAELSTVDSAGRAGLRDRPPTVRNLVVYGAFALGVLVLQLGLFVAVDEQSLPALAPVCGLVLPLLGYALGWLTVGIVFPAPAGSTVDRTPMVGAVVCLLAPVLITCAGFGILMVLR